MNHPIIALKTMKIEDTGKTVIKFLEFTRGRYNQYVYWSRYSRKDLYRAKKFGHPACARICLEHDLGYKAEEYTLARIELSDDGSGRILEYIGLNEVSPSKKERKKNVETFARKKTEPNDRYRAY